MIHTLVRRTFRRSSLAFAIGLGMAGLVQAQSTTGTLFGLVPAADGETVTVHSQTGLVRTASVDRSGRYTIGSLPVGTYMVMLNRGGKVVDTRTNVVLTVGAGTEVSFRPVATDLSKLTVLANVLPPIDVSSVSSRTVITRRDLQRLPLVQNAEAIALLSPGVSSGSGYFGSLSFGGSGVTENAYYINGFNTSEPLSNMGGVGLPYGAIDQQETYTGGYSARYGRSDGGVISQVGRRGTNEWHFGGQVLWEPEALANPPKNMYYSNLSLPQGYAYADPSKAGKLYDYRANDKSWHTLYSAYAGGPLIKDKLFVFAAVEQEKRAGRSTGSVESNPLTVVDRYHNQNPKWYLKLDWNINDDNILEYTGIGNKWQGSGTYYGFDYSTLSLGGPTGRFPTEGKYSSRYDIFKYTGYLTPDLTISALYGRSTVDDFHQTPDQDPRLPYLSGTWQEDPAITGGNSITNSTVTSAATSPDAGDRTHGVRLDVEYKLGDHRLAAGIDNMYFHANHEGQSMSGPGYMWGYRRTAFPDTPLNPTLGVGAPGSNYYVYKLIFVTSTSMSVDQKAYFLEDNWQLNDRLLLNLGLRNDHFTNDNNTGQAYVKSGNQWAPRLGASWDVFGDASLKVYGNLGRYYLALPDSVAIRGASASTYTVEYFTYSGIDPATGEPTGLKPFGPGPVSADGEYGVPPDPKTIAATNLRSQYQDEMILGFDKTLGQSWVTGANVLVRRLGTDIDDICDVPSIENKMVAMGLEPSQYDLRGCYLFNPGRTNSFHINQLDGQGYALVTMHNSDFGFTHGAKRKYYALNAYLSHPFDGKWQARLDYTFSRSYGNSEGQVRSDIGQGDVSKTEDWDFAPIMDYANGILFNDRTHEIKLFGAYQVQPEWQVSGRVAVQSGAPKSCLGYYGPTMQDPSGYGAAYHYCFGQPSRPGDLGRMPWTKRVDLGIAYQPEWADKKLRIGLSVFNVLNQRVPTQWTAVSENSPGTVSNYYGMSMFYTSPRWARLWATYDF